MGFFDDVEGIEILGEGSISTGLQLLNGLIIFSGNIYDADSNTVQDRISVLYHLHKVGKLEADKIVFRMNGSDGGSASAALAVYDSLKQASKDLNLPIRTEVYGHAYSAAAMILLQVGDERFGAANSEYMLHEVRRFVMFSEEKASDLKDIAKVMERVTNTVYGILAERCGKSVDEVREFINRRDVWMDANEALTFGLIDGIIGD